MQAEQIYRAWATQNSSSGIFMLLLFRQWPWRAHNTLIEYRVRVQNVSLKRRHESTHTRITKRHIHDECCSLLANGDIDGGTHNRMIGIVKRAKMTMSNYVSRSRVYRRVVHTTYSSCATWPPNDGHHHTAREKIQSTNWPTGTHSMTFFQQNTQMLVDAMATDASKQYIHALFIWKSMFAPATHRPSIPTNLRAWVAARKKKNEATQLHPFSAFGFFCVVLFLLIWFGENGEW